MLYFTAPDGIVILHSKQAKPGLYARFYMHHNRPIRYQIPLKTYPNQTAH